MESLYSVRKHGTPPFSVAAIHGGPGAPGSIYPLAHELGRYVGVLEPFQLQGSISGLVEELRATLSAEAALPVTLIGHSWGAMFGFIFAAHHPEMVRKLIMVGSGVFRAEYAKAIMPTRMSRFSPEEQAEVEAILSKFEAGAVADDLLARFGALMEKADTFCPVPVESAPVECRHNLHDSIWREAEEMRASGELLNLGRRITCPVVAIHGDYDPHPVEGVREPLSAVLSDFRMVVLAHCGHEPWAEREAREEFFELLRAEVTR